MFLRQPFLSIQLVPAFLYCLFDHLTSFSSAVKPQGVRRCNDDLFSQLAHSSLLEFRSVSRSSYMHFDSHMVLILFAFWIPNQPVTILAPPPEDGPVRNEPIVLIQFLSPTTVECTSSTLIVNARAFEVLAYNLNGNK